MEPGTQSAAPRRSKAPAGHLQRTSGAGGGRNALSGSPFSTATDRRSCVYKGAPESLTAAPVPGVRPSQLLFSSSFKRPLWAGAGARAVAEATDLKIREPAPGCRPWLLSESQGQLPLAAERLEGLQAAWSLGNTGELARGGGILDRWWGQSQRMMSRGMWKVERTGWRPDVSKGQEATGYSSSLAWGSGQVLGHHRDRTWGQRSGLVLG